MAVKIGGRHRAAASALSRRPGARVVASLAFSAGFGLLLGQGWLLDKLLAQNGRLLLRIERLEAMLGRAGSAPLAHSAGSGESRTIDRPHARPPATFARVGAAERGEWDPALEEFGGTAMQSWRWGEFLQRLGYAVERVRVEGPQGTGLAQVVFEDLGRGVTGHIPRGPVIAGEWLPVARALFAAVEEGAARHGAVSLTVEPDAPLPPDAAYEELGFVASTQQYYSPARTVKVPLLDDRALLDQMRNGTRYEVRLGQRRGVRVAEHSSSDVAAMTTFYDLLQDTARRNEFEIDGRSYYDDFMSVFGEDAALLLADLDGTPVAGAIVARALHEGIYLFGASSTEHRLPGATAYLQFEAMRWARRRGCTQYDLWGIAGEDSTPSGQPQRSRGGDGQGYHHFKLGFGGAVVTYPPAWDRPVRQVARDTSTRVDERVALTIGMATYNDFDGVYFTLQALRLYQDLADTELLVVDNYGCERTKEFVEGWAKGRYILATEAVGTAAPRDLVFREARGEAVLCCDSHILFAPGAIARLKAYYQEHLGCRDLLQGPLVYDDLQNISTHFDPNWRDEMWGTWGTDPRGLDPEGEPFEIPMQGLGVFSCRRSTWPGFNPRFRGFGGEEGYIHEKFRQAGGRCLCLPWLRWGHRFGRPAGVPYPLTVDDKFRNYLIGHAELGLDLAPVFEHFSEHLPEDTIVAIAEEALGREVTAAHPGITDGREGESSAALSAEDMPDSSQPQRVLDLTGIRDIASRRAIACFVEDDRHLIQQVLALRESWLYVQSADTDLVVMGPADVLARLPDDLVKIAQRPAADDPVWQGYRQVNSIACMNAAGAEQLDRYTHVLRTDVDTFITPAWNQFYPQVFTWGIAGYTNSDDVRRRIHAIAAQYGLIHRGHTNVGSTWYGPTEVVRRACSFAEMLTKHLLTHQFARDPGEWPGWYCGVATMYAGEIAANHCAPDGQQTDLLDFFSTSTELTDRYPHIHCWHTDEKFSKHWFMSGRYTREDARDLDIKIIRDYCMEMSFRSMRYLPGASLIDKGHEPCTS